MVKDALRARVVETLTLLASEEEQRKYQRAVPAVDVSAELFNQWEDCYLPEDKSFREGFLAAELESLASFNEVLNQVASDTPQELPAVEDFIMTDEWRRLSIAARQALLTLRE
jgi:hypothetical protein